VRSDPEPNDASVFPETERPVMVADALSRALNRLRQLA
jgi:hypothetical protein